MLMHVANQLKLNQDPAVLRFISEHIFNVEFEDLAPEVRLKSNSDKIAALAKEPGKKAGARLGQYDVLSDEFVKAEALSYTGKEGGKFSVQVQELPSPYVYHLRNDLHDYLGDGFKLPAWRAVGGATLTYPCKLADGENFQETLGKLEDLRAAAAAAAAAEMASSDDGHGVGHEEVKVEAGEEMSGSKPGVGGG